MRATVDEAIGPLRGVAPDLRWVAADRLHLTVRFLGDQTEERAAALAAVLAAAARRSVRMPLALEGVGAFPGFRRARVVWLGVVYEPKLELLYHDVETACMSLGFEVEGRAFRPHVTLGRVTVRLGDARARDLQRAARGIRFRTTTNVTSVDLMRSETGAGGSRYAVVARAPLREG